MGKKKNKDQKKNIADLKKEVETDFHIVEIEELYKRFETHPTKGLTTEKVEDNIKKYGYNALTPPKEKPLIVKFLLSFVDGFSLLLFFGGVLCFIAFIIAYVRDPQTSKDNVYLGSVLVIVVIITGLFSFYQNSKSSKIMDSFKKLVPQESLVIREGKKLSISAKEIVVGDICLIKGGDLIPADIRIIESKDFKVDNSSLTGESEPQKRHKANTSYNILETANVAIAYTYALEGTATGVAFATGDDTIMGRIAFLTSSLKQGKTPIAIEIDKFIRIITFIAVVIGLTFFILALALKRLDFVDSVVFFIGIIVANVPEGLLVTVTLSLTLTAQRMATKQCLVKNLESVETLGSTGVICSDKTGTLTQNKMLVSHYWCNKSEEIVVQKETNFKVQEGYKNETHKALCRCACICNRAEFRPNQADSIPVNKLLTNGDASESALIKYIEQFIEPMMDCRQNHPKVFEIPFNSVNKYQVSIHEVPNESRYLMVMKGAPERVVGCCSSILFEGEEMQLDEKNKAAFDEANGSFANQGERVLGFAQMWLSVDEYPRGCEFTKDDELTIELNNLCFLGLISLMDPPRDTVPTSVKVCRDAGVRVVMVTGDHPLTATAIARQVGIISEGSETVAEVMKRENLQFEEVDSTMASAIVISGDMLKNMSSDQLDAIVVSFKDIVFARTSPQQKLLIVESFQRQGYIVAVTGDGVNDSPALRKADIGVAMGIAGSDVAKQAADLILLNDDFSSIVLGIREGRLIFDNLKKSIAYTLTSNIPEIFPFLLFIIAQVPLALGTITILLIDLGTDMVPAISLAYEEPEKDIMSRKPRNPRKDRLVNPVLINYSYLFAGVWQAANGFLVYIFIMGAYGFDWSRLRSIGVKWDLPNVIVEDNYGQEWSYVARKNLEFTCHSGFFMSIVQIQIADLLISKTRRQSIFTQGLFNNLMLLVGICFEVILAVILIYVPVFNIALMTRPVHPEFFIFSVVNSILLWAVDEIRRVFIRRYPGGFIERETYY